MLGRRRRDRPSSRLRGLLVPQRPGSAKGIVSIAVEDETGVAHLVLWPDRFEKQRRLVLSAEMIACHGRVQREGEVVHVVTDVLEDRPTCYAAWESVTRRSRSFTGVGMERRTRLSGTMEDHPTESRAISGRCHA